MTDYRVRIELDDEYNANPGDFVAWSPAEDAEYVAQFERGEWTAYVVLAERTCEMGGWHVFDSLGGVVVAAANQDGVYDSAAYVLDEYLRETAQEMLSHVPPRPEQVPAA